MIEPGSGALISRARMTWLNVNGIEARKQGGSMGQLALDLNSGYVNRRRLQIVSHSPGDLARIVKSAY